MRLWRSDPTLVPPPRAPTVAEAVCRRNWIHVNRHWGPQRAQQHIPAFAQKIVAEYNADGKVSERAQLKAPMPGR